MRQVSLQIRLNLERIILPGHQYCYRTTKISRSYFIAVKWNHAQTNVIMTVGIAFSPARVRKMPTPRRCKDSIHLNWPEWTGHYSILNHYVFLHFTDKTILKMTSHIYMYLAYASFFVALITTERTTSEALHLQCFGSKVVCAKGSLFFVSCQKRYVRYFFGKNCLNLYPTFKR